MIVGRQRAVSSQNPLPFKLPAVQGRRGYGGKIAMLSVRTSPFGKIEGPLESAQDYQLLSKATPANARATHRRLQLRTPSAKADFVAEVALPARRTVDPLR